MAEKGHECKGWHLVDNNRCKIKNVATGVKMSKESNWSERERQVTHWEIKESSEDGLLLTLPLLYCVAFKPS